jgi:uncharacterized RDD family membrane protein YckC
MAKVVKLVGLRGPLAGKSRVLTEGEYKIGVNNADITVPDETVSASHALIRVGNPSVSIEDIGSRNGVYVNDPTFSNRLNYQALDDKDTFAVGPKCLFGVRILELKSAGFWIRLLSTLIDVAVLWAIWFIGMFLIGFFSVLASAGRRPSSLGEDQGLTMVVGVFVWFWIIVSTFGYITLMNGSRGQTLGKMATGLKIVHTDGSPITYGTAFLRYFMQILLANLSLCLMYIFLAVHPEKRGWHDMIANTRVVYKRDLDGK